MNFSLIICTYMRPAALLNLLNSVAIQTLYPNEILIIDGSVNNETELMLKEHSFNNLIYHKVDDQHRGLTKQRNYGISKIDQQSEVVCFLDDDTVLEFDYFEQVIKTFSDDQEIVGVGGVSINENRWERKEEGRIYNKNKYYVLGDYVYPEGLRNRVRNYLHLTSPLPSNFMPDFSHGRTSGHPLSGDIYEVDLLIGMSMAFRKKVFDIIQFSEYFEGYGLYEDADFSIRALKYGKNVVATSARLSHYHDAGGRPSKYDYGKMVIRNGWYVWRLKYSNPSFKAKFKWYAVHWVLLTIRFSNMITTKERKSAFTDALGRCAGLWSLLLKKPIIVR